MKETEEVLEAVRGNWRSGSVAVLAIVVVLLAFGEASRAETVNGDFQSGNLDGWTVREDNQAFPASMFAAWRDIGDGEYVGALRTGYSEGGVYVVGLAQCDITIGEEASEMRFDYRIIDAGADPAGGGGGFRDQLSVSLLTSAGNIEPIIAVDLEGMSVDDSYVKGVSDLGNGFARVRVDITGFAGADATIIFDLYDEDDGRLTEVEIDNVFVPEPGTAMLVMGGIVLRKLMRSRRKAERA